jgi:hypothetical protein
VFAGPVGAVADVGKLTFDGNGRASQTTTVSLNGTIIPSRSSLAGSYTVKPDCTGELSLTLPTATGPIPSTSRNGLRWRITKSKDDFRSFKETIKSERGLASRYARILIDEGFVCRGGTAARRRFG